IIGSVTSGPTRAIVPLAFEDNMPMITASATHAGVTVDLDTGAVFTNMFRSCFIDPFQGTKMAEFAVEVLGAQTAAILYSNEIDYSIGLMEAFVIRAEALGLEIVHIERHADEAVDFLGQLTNIAAHNPDVLFVPGYNYHVAMIGPQSVQAGLTDTILIGADGWAGSLDVLADPSSIEGSFYMTGFTHETTEQRVLDFIDRFYEEYGIMPNMFAAQAYDAAMILVAAIERTLEATSYAPDSEAFRLALIANMAATDITGVTGRITFDEYNNPQKTAVIIQVIDGEARFWGTF
ncbi:MAG: ABC transporter substrate-binding protein, partial [Oscillospiraceae bacterium]|nr:ABC transporter substrate-binding protein [Oscillospiraceae bacterium]